MRKRKALVTGGAGFIGSHMAGALLELGFDVTVLDNQSTGLRRNVPDAVRFLHGDVTDPMAVAEAFESGPDAVLHIAGQASTIRSFDDPAADLVTNTLGTVRVLEACLAHRVPRFLYASSMTIYGHSETLPIGEDQPPRPVAYYGITKYAAERYVLATAARNDLKAPFSATAFRMFNVYGERQRLDNPYQGVMGIFIGNMLRGEPITIHGDGEQTRDFVHIADVTRAWMEALSNPAAHNQVFNLGCGERISINRLVDEVLASGGFSRSNYQICYGPLRPGDQRHMAADISRARALLDWQPGVSLPDGLRRTLEWAKEELISSLGSDQSRAGAHRPA